MSTSIVMTSREVEAIQRAAMRAAYVAKFPCEDPNTRGAISHGSLGPLGPSPRCGKCRSCRAKNVIHSLAEFENPPKEEGDKR